MPPPSPLPLSPQSPPTLPPPPPPSNNHNNVVYTGEHESESSMGESKSYSINNHRIWNFILDMARAADVHDAGTACFDAIDFLNRDN